MSDDAGAAALSDSFRRFADVVPLMLWRSDQTVRRSITTSAGSNSPGAAWRTSSARLARRAPPGGFRSHAEIVAKALEARETVQSAWSFACGATTASTAGYSIRPAPSWRTAGPGLSRLLFRHHRPETCRGAYRAFPRREGGVARRGLSPGAQQSPVMVSLIRPLRPRRARGLPGQLRSPGPAGARHRLGAGSTCIEAPHIASIDLRDYLRRLASGLGQFAPRRADRGAGEWRRQRAGESLAPPTPSA